MSLQPERDWGRIVHIDGRNIDLDDVRTPRPTDNADVKRRVAIGLCDEDDHDWVDGGHMTDKPMWCRTCKLANVTLADLGQNVETGLLHRFEVLTDRGASLSPERPPELIRARIEAGLVCDEDEHEWLDLRPMGVHGYDECVECGLAKQTLRSLGQRVHLSDTYVEAVKSGDEQ